MCDWEPYSFILWLLSVRLFKCCFSLMTEKKTLNIKVVNSTLVYSFWYHSLASINKFLWFCSGIAGSYKLDQHGDRDVNLSIIYTTTDNKVLCSSVVIILPFRSKYTVKPSCAESSAVLLFYASMCEFLLSFHAQYKILFTFNTEHNQTKVVETDPSFIWGKRLPDFKPGQGIAKHTHVCTSITH